MCAYVCDARAVGKNGNSCSSEADNFIEIMQEIMTLKFARILLAEVNMVFEPI